MTRVVLYCPEVEAPLDREVAPGESLLAGTAPDPARLGEGLLPGGGVPASWEVASRPVSRNHVLVSHRGNRVTVADAGSANGTWLRLPARWLLDVPPDAPIHLDLARQDRLSARTEPPADARWRGAAEYPAAVSGTLAAWLRERRLPVQVRVAGSRPDAGEWLDLGDGSFLVLDRSGETAPVEWFRAHDAIVRYVAAQAARFAVERAHDGDPPERRVLLVSPAFRAAHWLVTQAARERLPLLLLGERGTGKEVLARCYHRHAAPEDDDPHGGKFVAVNCAMLSRELACAELFGAVRGAYSGCDRDRTGLVAAADRGTLLLDEVADLPVDVQAMLLRFLELGEYRRLGDSRASHADVRLVCATNRDLEAEVEQGRFRDDLYDRIRVMTVRVPPLRERREEIAEYLRARSFAGPAGSSGPGLTVYDALPAEARDRLIGQEAWAANFRGLRTFVDRLRALAFPPPSAPGGLPAPLWRQALGAAGPTAAAAAGDAAPGEGWGLARWQALLSAATDAFSRHHGGRPPDRAAEIDEFSDLYVKPAVVAHCLGLQGQERMPAALRLDRETLDRLPFRAGDAETVRRALHQYFVTYRETAAGRRPARVPARAGRGR